LSDERRKHQRTAAKLKVTYKSVAALEHAYSSDISEGGLFIPSKNLLPVGAVVGLILELPPPGEDLTTIARVARVVDEDMALETGQSQGMGMEFLEVDGTPINHVIGKFLFKRSGERKTATKEPGIDARILVVDDSEFHLNQTAEALVNAGYDVVTASDGVEGLRVAVRQKLDLIVSDVKMPNMNGWHLLRMIRNRASLASIPVIFLTTLNSDEERLLGYKLGVDDYVGKGFTEQELLLRVRRVLERSTAQRGVAKEKALKGDLTQVSLPSLLSLLELEQRTGHLLIIRDSEIANLLVRDGTVVSVDIGTQNQGKTHLERFFHVLDWETGEFELSAADISVEDAVGMSTSHALIEHARIRDEEAQD
jgi:DNA-binding response OmpR family regulator/Tfp pilus assembly protein PilZ